MFERRLKVVLMVFVAGWAIVALRLFVLQVVRADEYREKAQLRLIKYEKTLEPMRGRILDRNGRVLASDEPKWAIAIHYSMLKPHHDEYDDLLAEELLEDSKLLERHARNLLRLKGVTATDQNLIDDLIVYLRQEVNARWVASEVEAFWQLLSALSAEQSREDLRTRAADITDRIGRWKAAYVIGEALGKKEAAKPQIREETQCHPILTGLDRQQRIDVQSRLRQRFAWLFDLGAVEVADLSKREYHQAKCLAHVVGHQRQVTPDDVKKRPYRKRDKTIDLGGYRNRDMKGESGVEHMCEKPLRGRRGSLTVYRDERPALRIEPVNGKDVTLTIDYALQSGIYDLLDKAVSQSSEVPGGSVVVLDIPTREVLALVSYPSYDPNTYRSDYPELSRDFHTFPLHFRAVSRQHEPGSIVKPLTIVAAHSAGLIDEQTRFDCQGRLDPNMNKFRCWVPAGASRSIHHGSISSEEAIKHSCNVFCFHLGDLFWKQRGGPEGLQLMSEWMNRMGLGLPTGIGLREEAYGIAPSPRYLWDNRPKHPAQLSDPLNYAIGQGEMQVTPLQAANLVATYASGLHGPVRLLKHEQNTPPTSLPVEDSVWRIIRRGMYQVVNVTGGTATSFAKLEPSPYVLCGKSGSAQTTRWITEYRVDYHDGDGERSKTVSANNGRFARDEFVRQMMPEESVPRDQAERIRAELRDSIIRATPAAKWPAEVSEDRRHSHAWFVAFLQPKGADGLPDWNAQARIAIAVLLEFGGSGGKASGPVCRDVAEMIIKEFPRYVAAQQPLAMRDR